MFGAKLVNRMFLDPTKRTLVSPHYYFKFYPHITGASFLHKDDKKVAPIYFADDEGNSIETDPRVLLYPGYLRGGLTIAGCVVTICLFCWCKTSYFMWD